MSYSNLNIQTLPAINKIFRSLKSDFAYDKPNVINSHKKMINEIELKYGKFIEKWQDVFNIDKGVIISFICTESGGKNAPKNKFNAVGLMQVTPDTAYEIITKWSRYVDVPISSQSKSFFQSKVPSFNSWSSKRLPTAKDKSEILLALTNEEFNIAVGTACIRWLIEALGSLDKVMVSYNAGFYGTRNKLKGKNIEQIEADKTLPLESRAYVVKMLGVFGFMDLYYNVLNK